MVSVGKLEDLLTDKQIESILNCEKSLTANQKLVDYLVEKIQSKLSILDFCGYLERIKNALELQNILKALRKGLNLNDFTSHIDNFVFMYYFSCYSQFAATE